MTSNTEDHQDEIHTRLLIWNYEDKKAVRLYIQNAEEKDY